MPRDLSARVDALEAKRREREPLVIRGMDSDGNRLFGPAPDETTDSEDVLRFSINLSDAGGEASDAE